MQMGWFPAGIEKPKRRGLELRHSPTGSLWLKPRSREAAPIATIGQAPSLMARTSWPLRVSALLVLSSLLRFTSFVGVSTVQRSPAVPRRGEGFEGSSPSPKAKAGLSREQLERDHGDSWQMVDKILKGERAESPEAMMRARFTALRFKDPQFLGATEREEGTSIKKRSAGWAKTLGLEEKDFAEKIGSLFGSDTESLQEPVSFEVISADEDSVEFKIRCRNGKTLHEKSRFQKDRKWGYVYSGDSEFAQWN